MKLHDSTQAESRFAKSALLTVLVVAAMLWVVPVAAQDDESPAQLREQTREQIREQDRTRLEGDPGDPLQEQERQQLQQRLREGVDSADGLEVRERTQMRAHLEVCLSADVPPEDLAGLFPVEGQRRLETGTALKLQERVVAALQAGLPVEPLLAKIREGYVKGVPEARIEAAAGRVADHLSAARAALETARTEGMSAPEDPRRQREQIRTMTQHMWSGLEEGDLVRLREQARLRLRDGSCSTDDFVGACGAAARMMEHGAARADAVDTAGEALRHGWNRSEMSELGAMVAAGELRGGPVDRMLREMRTCLGDGMGPGEMTRYMMQAGWMGPADLDGPGGHGAGPGHAAGDPGYSDPHGDHHGGGGGGGGGGGSGGGGSGGGSGGGGS
jgi:hypothetical protein